MQTKLVSIPVFFPLRTLNSATAIGDLPLDHGSRPESVAFNVFLEGIHMALLPIVSGTFAHGRKAPLCVYTMAMPSTECTANSSIWRPSDDFLAIVTRLAVTPSPRSVWHLTILRTLLIT